MRRTKSEAKVSQRAEVSELVVAGESTFLDAVRAAEEDLRAAGSVADVSYESATDTAIRVTLA